LARAWQIEVPMAHRTERSDVIDMLEEAVTLRHPLAIELRDGRRFVDRVRDVITVEGEDYAVFRDHEAVPVGDIVGCARAIPLEPTYAGKT
jgi:transcriptional antiterminator Rof (Rho-off)